MAAPAYESLRNVLQAIAHKHVEPGLADVFLRLFDGHDIPALHWVRTRRRGFYKAPGIGRRIVFEAHLLGVLMAGAYPFRGVGIRCGCEKGKHRCDGLGTRYVCVDLDAKNGEQDITERCRAVMTTAWRLGLLPVVFSSRSGNGAHVFVFFNNNVTTRQAHLAGRHLAELSGVFDRCDIIPSVEHYAGLGTLHALPLSPMAECGGSVLFDSHLRPVQNKAMAVSLLRWADENRSPSYVIEALARAEPPLSSDVMPVTVRRKRKRIMRESKQRGEASSADDQLLRAMRASHPQFRRALATGAERWRGKRSARDAYLAGYMRRQGMSPAGIVKALLVLPGTKAKQRGEEYAWTLVEAQVRQPASELILAGQPLRPAAAKQQRQEVSWAPWAARVAPPQQYGSVVNPWWRESVQGRLKTTRSGVDGIALAYLVDRYYRGAVQRRMFYVGRRELARALRFPARTLGVSVTRLAERFPDVLRMVKGKPHPRLRLANGYYVPEHVHKDAVDWYLRPGQSGQSHLSTLPYKQEHEGLAAGYSGGELVHASVAGGDWLPF